MKKKLLLRGCARHTVHACPVKTINRAQWGYCLDPPWRPQKGCFWFPDSEPRYFHHSSLAGPPCQTLYKLLFDRCKEAWKTLPYGAAPPPTPHPPPCLLCIHRSVLCFKSRRWMWYIYCLSAKAATACRSVTQVQDADSSWGWSEVKEKTGNCSLCLNLEEQKNQTKTKTTTQQATKIRNNEGPKEELAHAPQKDMKWN